MKIFRLNGEMVIVETFKQIDRVRDVMCVVLSKDIEFKTQYYHEKAMRKKDFTINISKEKNPELWSKMKDLSNDDMMDFLLEVFNKERERRDQILSLRKEFFKNLKGKEGEEKSSIVRLYEDMIAEVPKTLFAGELLLEEGMPLFDALDKDFIELK